MTRRLTKTTNNLQLRKKIQEITDTYTGEKIGAQPRLIAELAAAYPHSITLLEEKKAGDPHSLQFNCHEYAFGLRDSKKVKRISLLYEDIFPDGHFVSWLIANALTETSKGKLQQGDVVVYFSKSEATHSGLWVDGKIRSKWGGCHLWEHGLYEIPISYGSRLRFFQALPSKVSAEEFLRFAKGRHYELYANTEEWPFD